MNRRKILGEKRGGYIELREPRKLINELAVRDGVLRVFPAETIGGALMVIV